jgi:hypothetical protein
MGGGKAAPTPCDISGVALLFDSPFSQWTPAIRANSLIRNDTLKNPSLARLLLHPSMRTE